MAVAHAFEIARDASASATGWRCTSRARVAASRSSECLEPALVTHRRAVRTRTAVQRAHRRALNGPSRWRQIRRDCGGSVNVRSSFDACSKSCGGESELTRWQPGFAGRRSWHTVRRHLLAAAGRDAALRQAWRLYVPECFYAEERDAIRARRVALWQELDGAEVPPRQMLVIAEMKRIQPATGWLRDRLQARSRPAVQRRRPELRIHAGPICPGARAAGAVWTKCESSRSRRARATTARIRASRGAPDDGECAMAARAGAQFAGANQRSGQRRQSLHGFVSAGGPQSDTNGSLSAVERVPAPTSRNRRPLESCRCADPLNPAASIRSACARRPSAPRACHATRRSRRRAWAAASKRTGTVVPPAAHAVAGASGARTRQAARRRPASRRQ